MNIENKMQVVRYIVNDRKGDYQVGYSAQLGEKIAKSYAIQTARKIGGEVIEEFDNGERKNITI